MTALGDLDRARIGELHSRELARFRADRPRTLAMIGRARAHMPNGTPMAWMASDNDQPVYIDHGRGAGFTDLDGFTYLDFNASDMAMFCGHANPAIVAAVQAQAARSTQFLLPTAASVEVAEELARRYPVPQWQFTLSATQANTEVIRLARAVTGRDVIVLFQGHYHGHFDEGLVDLDGGQVAALSGIQIVHADGTFEAHDTGTFTGTADGRPGTVVISGTSTGSGNSGSGQLAVGQGTGALAGLHAQGTFQPTITGPTTSEGTYAVQFHFGS